MAKSKFNMNPNNLSPEQIQMAAHAIKNAQDIVCKCGCNIFCEGVKLKKVSKLLIGAADDKILPIPAVYCAKCLNELSLEDEPPVDNKDEIILDFKRKE